MTAKVEHVCWVLLFSHSRCCRDQRSILLNGPSRPWADGCCFTFTYHDFPDLKVEAGLQHADFASPTLVPKPRAMAHVEILKNFIEKLDARALENQKRMCT